MLSAREDVLTIAPHVRHIMKRIFDIKRIFGANAQS